jgi:hypothetical protein
MKTATLIAAGAALLPSLVAAHAKAVPGAPSIFGRRDIKHPRSLQKRHPHREAKRHAAPTDDHLPSKVKPRQAANTDGPCGAGVGSCAAGVCCSPSVRITSPEATRPNVNRVGVAPAKTTARHPFVSSTMAPAAIPTRFPLGRLPPTLLVPRSEPFHTAVLVSTAAR